LPLSGVDLHRHLSALHLPSELSNQSNEAIFAYLRDLRPSRAAVEIYRQRIMVVGPGNAGKSSLIHQLKTGKFTPHQFLMTDGVSIEDWVLNGEDESAPEIHISFWDFGGQEMYLHTHPLIFSDKTIYLLVCDPRSTTHLRQLGSYLLNIRNSIKKETADEVPSAPIILVTTHSSEVDDRETRRLLLDDLVEGDDVVSHHCIDSSTGEGINDLKQALRKYIVNDFCFHSQVRVPRWYLEVEANLKQQSNSTFRLRK
jgi:internalin A